MKGRTLNIIDSCNSLQRKGCKIDMQGQNVNILTIPNNKVLNKLGNKSWGLISFLFKYKHFMIRLVVETQNGKYYKYIKEF